MRVFFIPQNNIELPNHIEPILCQITGVGCKVRNHLGCVGCYEGLQFWGGWWPGGESGRGAVFVSNGVPTCAPIQWLKGVKISNSDTKHVTILLKYT